MSVEPRSEARIGFGVTFQQRLDPMAVRSRDHHFDGVRADINYGFDWRIHCGLRRPAANKLDALKVSVLTNQVNRKDSKPERAQMMFGPEELLALALELARRAAWIVRAEVYWRRFVARRDACELLPHCARVELSMLVTAQVVFEPATASGGSTKI